MDRLEAVERLAKLRDSGVLTDAEYAQQKRILMSSSSPVVTPAAAPSARTSVYREESQQEYVDPAPHIHIHNSNTQATQSPAYPPLAHPYMKSTLVAYLLWFFLFPISAHRLYLHRWGTALLQIFWGVFAVISAVAGGLVMGLLFGSAAASAVSELSFLR